MSGTSYRLDEAYVKVGKDWKYLYRAVDSTGQTVGFMLSAEHGRVTHSEPEPAHHLFDIAIR